MGLQSDQLETCETCLTREQSSLLTLGGGVRPLRAPTPKQNLVVFFFQVIFRFEENF